MITSTNYRRIVTVVMLIISIVTTAILITVFAQPLSPSPILTISTNEYQVYYYNVTSLRKPILIVRGYLNNNPVPFTISLFALGNGHMYTVGYYYGVGLVNISLLLLYRIPSPINVLVVFLDSFNRSLQSLLPSPSSRGVS
jgi:hypothetical protein